MRDAVVDNNIHNLKVVKTRKHVRPRSSVSIEILPDGLIGKMFVNVAKEDWLQMLNAIAMVHIRILSTMQDHD
jgi:hypothetical protein